MKRTLLSLLLTLLALPTFAATPAQEKAFVDTYRKALEAGDAKTLSGFLYTKGADPKLIELFTALQRVEPGDKIVSVELVKPTPAEEADLNKTKEMPDGRSYKMPLKPYKKLVVKTESKSANSSGKSTRTNPVAELDGKLVIPVPVSAK